MKIVASVAACLLSLTPVLAGVMPESLYEEWRKSAWPSCGVSVDSNPAALLWPSVKHWEKRDVLYNVCLSRDFTFSGETLNASAVPYCFFNPHRRLEPGTWYWKYEVVEDGTVTDVYGPYSFVVREDADGLDSPDFRTFSGNIPEGHPRVMNYGKDMDSIRMAAPSHPLYASVVGQGEKILSDVIYRGPVTSPVPAEARKFNRTGMAEVDRYTSMLEAYVLASRKDFLDNLMERTEVLLGWPTDDLLGSRVLGALAMGFDVLYDELPVDIRSRILELVDRQFRSGLEKWPGLVEARHVENHFWQMELAGNFTAAVATFGHIESAGRMLEYTYELFIARFPNLAGQDGGWAEGEGYYSVNKTAIVDMALLVRKLGKADLFRMGWYRNLPDYFIYFSPVASPVSGFGDMNDRVESGSLKGRSEMLVLASEEGDGKALYRLFSSLRPDASFYGEPLDPGYWKKPLSKIEPWYQIVNDIRLSPDMVEEPENFPEDKVFFGVGTAAMHSDVLHPESDATVFFRSSPFGAKGHAHADQNSFNISRKGERIFYSTGYYTSFADPHSLTSYRHTRAHNTILVDGIGQAFGHEGYGWIKRYAGGGKLSYVCGDATFAYKDITDEQFLGFLSDNGIPHDAANGFGNPGLTKFERHLVYARPDVVIVYDVLEAGKPVEWQLLLHTLMPSVMDGDGSLALETLRSCARADVFGSTGLESGLTDKFHSPAVDFKKKYRKGTPDACHATYRSAGRTSSMRFLTVIRLGDRGDVLPVPERISDSEWKTGPVTVSASMKAGHPAFLEVRCGEETIAVYDDKTVYNDGNASFVEENRVPSGNRVWEKH